MEKFVSLKELEISIGKRARLHRMLYDKGNANGTLLILPIDQGLEHGPMDFFQNPASKNPEYELRLAEEGKYSAIVFHIGIAQKYFREYAGKVPLILKINGKTAVPSDKQSFSPLDASVEDAVRLGADAVGYTLYTGSPSQDRDIAQLNEVRRDCEKFGMPLFVWSYPRGEAIEAKGGKDSLYAVDYAARAANELGADIVKLNMPKKVKAEKLGEYKAFLSKSEDSKPYIGLEDATDLERMKMVVESAGKTLVLVSGGEKADDRSIVEKAETAMKAGCTGLIFGRNMWQRKHGDALRITAQIKEMMKGYPR
ncbi:MAG: fructose-bisphosphate aldolase [archaeon]